MCGIVGIAGERADEHAVARGVASLIARGPDDNGTLAFLGCALGSTRLSIIDLSPSGHQPMRDKAHNIAIAFNGEIYNYKEVRRALEGRGHTFTSHSDTEVILKTYAEYGETCPEHLDGQFAFAIWDSAKEQLFLARDRFGEKPLYVTEQNGSLFFASEIKALFAEGVKTPCIDPASLDNYLSLMFVPPWRSIYEGITPLLPAHSAVWKNGTLTTRRYWKLSKDTSPDETTAVTRTRELLTDAVRSRMLADVEVGAFLSGGIDSSLVVQLAAKESGKPLKTFSAGFEGFIDELPYAAKIATLAHTDHHPAQMKDDLLATFLGVANYFDEPFGDSSNVPTSLIAKHAQSEVKVVLSGDGGDELFYGYGQYTRFNHLPKIEKLFATLSGVDAFSYFKQNILQQFSPSERAKLLLDGGAVESDPTTHIDYSEATTPLEKINLTDFYLGLPGDMLTKVDRASMMHSLEVRSPFLHPELAQFAYNLPAHLKTDGRRGKIILEKAFSDVLPDGFFNRKKQGFGAPVAAWLHKPEFKKQFDEWLRDPLLSSHLSVDAVRATIAHFYDGDDSLRYKVWILFSLEAWLRTRI